jgi:hypothetical protein
VAAIAVALLVTVETAVLIVFGILFCLLVLGACIGSAIDSPRVRVRTDHRAE